MLCKIFPSLCQLLDLTKGSTGQEYCTNSTSDNETKRCACTDPSVFTTSEIKSCVNRLIYKPDRSQTDKELFTIVILRKKAAKFNFLEGFTKLYAIGSWRDIDSNGRIIKSYPDEKNVQIDVEFKDRLDEAIHLGLLNLLSEYNKREVGEQLLYMRVCPVEGSTL